MDIETESNRLDWIALTDDDASSQRGRRRTRCDERLGYDDDDHDDDDDDDASGFVGARIRRGETPGGGG